MSAKWTTSQTISAIQSTRCQRTNGGATSAVSAERSAGSEMRPRRAAKAKSAAVSASRGRLMEIQLKRRPTTLKPRIQKVSSNAPTM